jgi:hypothetical protein
MKARLVISVNGGEQRLDLATNMKAGQRADWRSKPGVTKRKDGSYF